MTNTNRDSAAWIVVLVVFLLVLGGGGLLAYQRVRSAQMMALDAQRRAEAAMQLSKMEQALQQATPESAQQLRNQQIAADPAADEMAIQAKLFDQQADWNNANIDAFMKVYWKSDQLTFSSGGKVTRGWQATLDNYKAKYSTKEQMGTLTFSELEFQRLDSSVMLVLGQWHLARNENSIGGNFSLVWKKIQNEWLIVHDHTSLASTP